MTPGPDDEHWRPSEPTFADVMRGFSVDSGRTPRGRRWGRRGNAEAEPSGTGTAAAAPSSHQAESQHPRPQTDTPQRTTPQADRPPAHSVPGPDTGPIDMRIIEADEFGHGVGASAVRPYTWTRGRTKSGLDLAIETLVSTSQRGREQMSLLQVEHRAVAELCEQTRSVAEVAALMSLPLGVARVLLGDMAGLGVVNVHQTASSAGSVPDLALMERVLSGLRRL